VIVVQVRAAVVVLEAVEILGLVGALVDGVGDAVVVVVFVGATVVVLEAVEILGLVGTAIETIDDAVMVSVAEVRSPAHAHETAEHGAADGMNPDPRPRPARD